MAKDLTKLDLAEKYALYERVARSLVRGNTYAEIAKAQGLTRVQVQDIEKEWANLIRYQAEANTTVREQAMEFLRLSRTASQEINRETWDVVEEAKAVGSLKERTAALQLAHKINTDTVKLWQQAGLTEDVETIQRLRETEEKQEVLINLIKDVAGNCEHCKNKIMHELQSMQGKAEVVAIEA